MYRYTKGIQYRCYKNVENGLFRDEFKSRLSTPTEYYDFETTDLQVLDNHATIKKINAYEQIMPHYVKGIKKSHYEKIYV